MFIPRRKNWAIAIPSKNDATHRNSTGVCNNLPGKKTALRMRVDLVSFLTKENVLCRSIGWLQWLGVSLPEYCTSTSLTPVVTYAYFLSHQKIPTVELQVCNHFSSCSKVDSSGKSLLCVLYLHWTAMFCTMVKLTRTDWHQQVFFETSIQVAEKNDAYKGILLGILHNSFKKGDRMRLPRVGLGWKHACIQSHVNHLPTFESSMFWWYCLSWRGNL